MTTCTICRSAIPGIDTRVIFLPAAALALRLICDDCDAKRVKEGQVPPVYGENLPQETVCEPRSATNGGKVALG